jgi:hypothetical protein
MEFTKLKPIKVESEADFEKAFNSFKEELYNFCRQLGPLKKNLIKKTLEDSIVVFCILTSTSDEVKEQMLNQTVELYDTLEDDKYYLMSDLFDEAQDVKLVSDSESSDDEPQK